MYAAGGPWGAVARDVGGALAVTIPSLATTMLNRVTGFGLARLADEEQLDEIQGFFANSGVRYAIAIAPHARPPEVTGLLADRGYVSGYGWTKFSRAAEPPGAVLTDLRVERVGPEGADAFALVVAEAYDIPETSRDWLAVMPGLPGWDCYVAFAGDEPAAAGALFVTQRTGWFGFAGTRPQFRRRGGQNAIMAARLRRAAELDCTAVVTETGERQPDRPSNSYRNILRNGFRPAYVRPNFLSPLRV
jgi:hypothetical protein